MSKKTRILLKLTGTVLADSAQTGTAKDTINSIAHQLKALSGAYQFGIVIGGGNFFRGSIQGHRLSMTPWAAHTTGMLATVMNGIILKDLFMQSGLESEVLSAIDCPLVAAPISINAVQASISQEKVIIFVGGTGVPYFTTDTNAVIRCLQLGSTMILKGTSVNGIYDDDPNKNNMAKLIKKITYDNALNAQLGIMDATAYTMASTHDITTKIFNIFEQNSLTQALTNTDYGSTIHP